MYLSSDNKLQSIEDEILEILSKEPATPDEIAGRLKIGWATAQGRLLKLAGEGKVFITRKGRVNVYYAKSHQRLRFIAPNWVKVKGLKELSEELEEYFPSNLTAAGMVERERTRY